MTDVGTDAPGARVGTLAAMVARIIPSDDLAGAAEADAVSYAVRSLAAERSAVADSCWRGLASVDRHTRAAFGRPFEDLDGVVQDELLAALDKDEATWFGEGAKPFFELVRDLAIEGTFSDPRWGGNAGSVGWTILGYGGPRPVWTEDDQRIEQLR